MKKLILILILSLMLSTPAMAADIEFTMTIPDAKTEIALEGFLEVYPNRETIPDPAWVDLKDGSEAPQIARYTDKQWVRERIRRWIVQSIFMGRNRKAKNAVSISKDDGAVQ